jgi:protein phosphatase 1 regulatory subunit 3A/B/C/D/E
LTFLVREKKTDFQMLDLLPNFPEGSSNRMPMDFSPYLLSASPPSSGFELMSFSSQNARNHLGISPHAIENANNSHQSYPSLQMSQLSGIKKKKKGPLKSIIIRTENPWSCSSDSEGDCFSTFDDTLTSSTTVGPQSPVRSTKRVSFADHAGLALAQVRLVKESPDEPPELSADVLSSLTDGASADVTDNPPITLCFAQPASDYLAFRDKINRHLVSLENVILTDYTVEGTIKVKNITFEKRVFVRLSLDEWETFEDFEATYVPGPGVPGYSEPYDTFSFTMDISPSFDVMKKVQFAVCFNEHDIDHWDNNGGENYTIISEHYQEVPPSPSGLPFFSRYLPEKRTDSWAEFSGWRDGGHSVDDPYY